MGSPSQPSPEPRLPAPGPEPRTPQPDDGERLPPSQPDGLEAIRAALVKERQLRKAAEGKLARLQQRMSDDKKAHVEAIKSAGLRAAAAEFRAAAAGKLADPAAALQVLDLSCFVGDEGEVDSVRLAAMVDKLAAALRPAPRADEVR